MPSVHDTAYPRLKSNPSTKELFSLYTPTTDELELAQRVTRRPVTCLSFLVLLKTFQRLGYAIALATVPASIIRHIVMSSHLSTSQQDLSRYDASATRKRHLSIIREYLQISPFHQTAHQAMIQALEMAVLAKHDLVDLINIAIEELARQRFELPGFSTLERTARSIRKQKTEQIYQQVDDALTPEERQQLEGLFSDREGLTHWEQLKQEPGKPLLSRLKNWTERLHWLSTLQLSRTVLSDIPSVKVQYFAAEAQTLNSSRMKTLNPAKRYTLAAALLTRQYAQTLDDIAEMFIKRMRQLHHSAKDALAEHRLDTQQRTDALIMTLRDVIVAYQSDGDIPKRFVAMEAVIGDQPESLIKQCEAHLAHDGNNYFPFLPQFYRSHRAPLFRLMDALVLKPSTRDTTLSEAIAFIKRNRNKRRTWLPITEMNDQGTEEEQSIVRLDISWVPTKWWALVTGQNQCHPVPTQVHRVYFEICVFSHLLLEVQSGDMYIEGSHEYGDYYEQLISWQEYTEKVAEYGEMVELPTHPSDFVTHVKQWLISMAEQVDQSFPTNTKVTYQKGRLVIQRHRRQTPDGFSAIRNVIGGATAPRAFARCADGYSVLAELDPLLQTDLRL